MIRLDIVTQYVVMAGLLGAILWDLITWLLGLPTSSSHALIGGYAGAAMARAILLEGWRAAPTVIIPGGWTKTLVFIVAAPAMGFVLGLAFMITILWIFQRRSPRQVDTLFRKLQLLSAAAYSLGHGGNDAQKTMGLVAGALFAGGVIEPARLRHQLGALALAHHPRSADRHCTGYLLRRLADRAHHGIEDHQTEAGERILRRGRGCDHAVRNRAGGDSREHHAHHYRCDCGGWDHEASLCGALGCRHAYRVGMDLDHSGFGSHGDVHFLGDPVLPSHSVEQGRLAAAVLGPFVWRLRRMNSSFGW